MDEWGRDWFLTCRLKGRGAPGKREATYTHLHLQLQFYFILFKAPIDPSNSTFTCYRGQGKNGCHPSSIWTRQWWWW